MGYQYTLQELLEIIRPHARKEVGELETIHRRVYKGLLSVGLKIHCFGENNPLEKLMASLGGVEVLKNAYGTHNHYRLNQSSLCVVLPPVGSAEAAILLLECIGRAIGVDLFNNKNFQIQICSPGKLSGVSAALLGVGFYLGSDTIRVYSLDDLKTTFSGFRLNDRGRRLVLHDAHGVFDENFEWWRYKLSRLKGMRRRRKGKKRKRHQDPLEKSLVVSRKIPFRERTDVLLGSASRKDIRNVNFLATLLVHEKHDGFWGELGTLVKANMLALLRAHQLQGVAYVPWVDEGDEASKRDEEFFPVFEELMFCVLEECERYGSHDDTKGLLLGMATILDEVRALHEEQSEAYSYREKDL